MYSMRPSSGFAGASGVVWPNDLVSAEICVIALAVSPNAKKRLRCSMVDIPRFGSCLGKTLNEYDS